MFLMLPIQQSHICFSYWWAISLGDIKRSLWNLYDYMRIEINELKHLQSLYSHICSSFSFAAVPFWSYHILAIPLICMQTTSSGVQPTPLIHPKDSPTSLVWYLSLSLYLRIKLQWRKCPHQQNHYRKYHCIIPR